MKRILLVSLLLTSCSVMIASDRGGVNPESIESVVTRQQLIALGALPLSSEKTAEGKTIETFLVPKQHGSISRAILHGTLDVLTGCAWELAGTPMESALEKKGTYCVRFTFDDQQRVENAVVLQ